MTPRHLDLPHGHTDQCWWDPDQARWNCHHSPADPPPPRSSPSLQANDQEPLVDVRDMLVVHTAMLREFRLLPVAVRRSAAGDRRHARIIDEHLTFVCNLLHHHHSGEDALLWPILRERTSPAVGAIIDEAEDQHEALDASLADVRTAQTSWSQQPDPRTADELAEQLESLYLLLRDHLDLEERALLPQAAATFTEQEWHAIGEAAVAALSKPDLALSFGMFAYEGDPAVLRSMLAGAPAVPRTLLPRLAPRLYARRARRVHGTTRP